MKKVWIIGWKDLLVLFRDRGALILMLAAPFVLTLGLGLVTGSFAQNNSTGTGLADIPLAVINLDEGELGTALVDVLTGSDLADLLEPEVVTDEATARLRVEKDELAALVVIPADFTQSVIPNLTTGERTTAVPIEVYANPARPISAGVVRNIVQAFVSRVDTGLTVTQVTVTQLVRVGLLPMANITSAAQAIGQQQMTQIQNEGAAVIEIVRETAVGASNSLNSLAYFVPGMAIIFLMFTVSMGGRSFLDERRSGTMARLLATPTHVAQVLGGKVFGIFLSGLAQVGVLVIGSTLLYQLYWGDMVGVLLLIVAVAIAATGWGLVLATLAKTPAQVTSYGSALMLIFGVLGGGFVDMPREGLLKLASRITPNAWALDGFMRLHKGGTLADITVELLALLVMGALLFSTVVLLFNRRSLLADR